MSEEVTSPLLTPQLVALRRAVGIGAVADLVLAAAATTHGPVALAAALGLLVMALVIWGGPRRYLPLVPWYGWTHAAIGAFAALDVLAGGTDLPTWTLALIGGAVSTAALRQYRPAGRALWRERDVEVQTWGGWTFERLAGARPGVLQSIVERGLGPVPRDLAWWEYRCFHLHPLARLVRAAKSTVGFFDAAGTADLEGFRLATSQTGEEQPWDTGERKERYGFFVATPADVQGRNRIPTATALDYQESRRNPSGDWIRRRITYLVMANTGDPTLLVGKVFLRAGRITIPAGYVILEAWREHRWDGAGP
ncbi:MAG: hypothetical protein GY898_07200 [Proteobacteria bacterium]|nr:hypothetical protein [Pseudomonadota bacterium]